MKASLIVLIVIIVLLVIAIIIVAAWFGTSENKRRCRYFSVLYRTKIKGIPLSKYMNKTEKQCQKLCSQKKCDFYHYNTFTKNCTLNKGQSQQNSYAGLKVSRSPYQCHKYKVLVNKKIENDKIHKIKSTNTENRKKCEDVCQNTAGCQFYNYDQQTNICQIHKAPPQDQTNTGFLIHPKIN